MATRLLLGAAFACAAGGMYLFFQALQAPGVAVPDAAPQAYTAHRRIAAVEARLPEIARNAEGFLRDSLQLTGACKTSCAQAALEIAQATRLYRLGQSNGAAGFLGQDPSLHFAAPAANPPATPASPAPVRVVIQAAAIAPPVAPAPVHISPTIVVPLPRPSLDADATTTPAATDDTAAPAPTQLASLPPAARAMPAPGPMIGVGDGTAIYDISARTVYLPDGERLEAHSGLGEMTDDPRFVDRRNSGPTPPGVYRLDALPNLFFGVEALRMVPVDGKSRFGRDGFLTHTYLLRGRPGQSNGCVVFPDYQRFLEAYKRGHIRRLVVVASLKGAPMQIASAD